MLLFICFIVLAQAYVFQWLIPEYEMLVANAAAATPDFSRGYIYLLLLVVVIAAIAIAIIMMTKKKTAPSNEPINPSLVK